MKSDAIYLVSCVSQKTPIPARARDLYVSQWFRLARDYVERHGDAWFILSAQHGLLTPDAVTAPYEHTLNTMDIKARRAWALEVRRQMDRVLPNADRCVVLAGTRYREFLIDYLARRFTVEVPMQGLGIGRQLQWLSRQQGGEKRPPRRSFLGRGGPY